MPLSDRCVAISTRSSVREMIAPGLYAILFPLMVTEGQRITCLHFAFRMLIRRLGLQLLFHFAFDNENRAALCGARLDSRSLGTTGSDLRVVGKLPFQQKTSIHTCPSVGHLCASLRKGAIAARARRHADPCAGPRLGRGQWAAGGFRLLPRPAAGVAAGVRP